MVFKLWLLVFPSLYPTDSAMQCIDSKIPLMGASLPVLQIDSTPKNRNKAETKALIFIPSFSQGLCDTMSKMKFVYIGIAIIAIGVLFYGMAMATAVPAGKSLVAFQLTDPPIVPNGTQSLFITYSSLQLHVIPSNSVSTPSNATTSGWVTVNGTGSVNLMSLTNVSRVIGTAIVNLNSTVNMARFNITSANITINGTSYPVTVPSSQVTAHVTQNSSLNTTSGVLVDMTPTVIEIYTANTTLFMMVPSVRAVVVSGVGTLRVGSTQPIGHGEHHKLEAGVPSITIENTSLSVSNSTVHIAVGVKDTSNSTATLRHLLLLGNENAKFNLNSTINSSIHEMNSNRPTSMAAIGLNENADANLNLTSNVSNYGINGSAAAHASSNDNATVSKDHGNYNGSNDHGSNDHAGAAIGVNLNSTLSRALPFEDVNVTASIKSLRTINFFVSQNGTLTLPFLTAHGVDDFGQGSSGFTLQPGQSAVLTFNGAITYAHGHIKVSIIPNDTYKVVITGEEDLHASANVTATANAI